MRGWLIPLLLCVSPLACADERILSFEADISVHPDSTMTVRETVRVRAEGVNIRRGIFRDFPTAYRDRFGHDYRVAFRLQGVSRDGRVEPHRVERRANGVRVYAGAADVFLAPGEYTYLIVYQTDRQLGYFAEHDELYWNATGNGWMFPIDAASARVSLPETVPAQDVAVEGYTGLLGAGGRDYAAESTAEGQTPGAWISSTRALAPREGLTVVVSWPKGHVHEPGPLERALNLVRDNRGLMIALSGFALVLGYLQLAWRRHGRDPDPGIVFPHYEPPPGYSPASARYIAEMGYDDRAFAAAVINLAVKGHLTISNVDTYILQRTSGGDAPLAAGERVLLEALFRDGDRLLLERDNHQLLRAAREGHLQSLKRDYEKVYFITNGVLLLPAVALLGIVVLVVFLLQVFSPAVIAVLVATAAMLLLYQRWMKAATPRGRALLDRLAGFRQYLEIAEKDELALRNPPEKTPELFERLLPFALALGVEQRWAERFATVFVRAATAQGDDYRPYWYTGTFDARDVGGFTRDVGRSFSSAIATAATPPGSSSGSGGGGFSGGGGGGGGGGGW